MDIEVKETSLKNVLLIKPPTIFRDFRGSYIETYNDNLYKINGVEQKFIQDCISTSKKNVLRGIHGDSETWKLVSCLYGKFYLLVVNNNKDSDQYMRWCSFELSYENNLQVLIPPKFGNGHYVLSDSTIFHYKQTTYYKRESQFTISWNDPKFNFKWPSKNPILSDRDKFAK